MAPSILTWSLLSAAGIAIAAPVARNMSPNPRLLRRDAPTYGDVDAWCPNMDMSDPDVVKMIWNDWGVGGLADTFAQRYNNEDRVVDFFNQFTYNVGNTGSYGCGDIDQDCLADLPTCEEDVANSQDSTTYWIGQAVRQVRFTRDLPMELLC